MLTRAQWESYERSGYLRLGKLLDEVELDGLQRRIDQIMLGTAAVDYRKLMMQLDSDTGRYEDAGAQTKGHKGGTLSYRKIEELELDPLFLAYIQKPIFKAICDHAYGLAEPINCFRAMFMNKPARKGTFLPWHQDRWSYLSRDPLITIWTALDPATRANGCVQVIPGSHRAGVINPGHVSGFLTPEQAAEHAISEKIEYLELQPGEAVLLHNYLLHASDVNNTDTPRRAFSVCYLPASTTANNGATYRTVLGAPPCLGYNPSVSAFLPVIDGFNRAGVSYVVVGGLATVLHGHLRVTADVDFVIHLDPRNVSVALETIRSLGYLPRLPIDPADFADPERRGRWIRKGMMVLSFYDPSDVTRSVDLFAEYPMDYDALLAHSVAKDLGGVQARVCSLDDLIALKRAAGRPIDREDASALEEIRRHE